MIATDGTLTIEYIIEIPGVDELSGNSFFFTIRKDS